MKMLTTRLKGWRRLALAGFTAMLLTGGPAQAFYWTDWPGSRIKPPDKLTPDDPDDGGPPGGPFEPPPGGGPDDPETPEPATIVTGLMGLAFLGANRLRRKLGEK